MKAWIERVGARPAVQRGIEIPVPQKQILEGDIVKSGQSILQR